jgi:hypothetical protein
MDADADAASVAESDDVSVMTEDDYGPQEGDSVQVTQLALLCVETPSALQCSAVCWGVQRSAQDAVQCSGALHNGVQFSAVQPSAAQRCGVAMRTVPAQGAVVTVRSRKPPCCASMLAFCASAADRHP